MRLEFHEKREENGEGELKHLVSKKIYDKEYIKHLVSKKIYDKEYNQQCSSGSESCSGSRVLISKIWKILQLTKKLYFFDQQLQSLGLYKGRPATGEAFSPHQN
jgi:hypothetical protein